jgi:uncharacterized protein YkwD
VTLTDDERRTLELHNARRLADGLPAFCLDARLTAAARAHSADMLAHGYLAHESFDGESFGARIARFGYGPWRWLAENVAFGSGALGAPATTFAGWMASAGHRRNIQNGTLREIGIGVRVGRFQGVAGTRVYTVDFGTR